MAVFTGFHEAIDHALNGHPFDTKKIPDMFDLEFREAPDEVGPPVNILVIYPNRYEWGLGGDVCKAELP